MKQGKKKITDAVNESVIARNEAQKLEETVIYIYVHGSLAYTTGPTRWMRHDQI